MLSTQLIIQNYPETTVLVLFKQAPFLRPTLGALGESSFIKFKGWPHQYKI